MAIIDDIYDALLDDAAYAALPERLARAVGARSCSFQVFEDQTPVHVASSYFSSEMVDYYVRHDLAVLDPALAWARRSAALGAPFASDDHMTRQQFRDGAMYNEYFRVFGDDTGVVLGAILPTQRGFVGLGLQRALTAPAYDEAEIAALTNLIPHVRRMTDARALVRSAAMRQQEAEAMLDGLAVGAVLVEVNGRIRLANAAARAAFDSRDGLTAAWGLLTAGASSDAAHLATAIAQACQRRYRDAAAITVGRPSGRKPYRLIVSPHSPFGSDRTLALVLIDDPEREAPELSNLLIQLFELTPAEADLAVRLSRGASVEEACEARGVLVSTGRTQLKRILEKTDSRRQGELMTLIARLPAFRASS